MIDIGFYHIFQLFVKLIAKNMKGGSEKSEILCVGQLARAEQKIWKQHFSQRPPFFYFFKIYCQKIFVVSFKSYVQLVPEIH